jgi:hypothetical protein
MFFCLSNLNLSKRKLCKIAKMLFKIWFPLILVLLIVLDVNARKSNNFNLSKPTKITNCKAELDDKTIIDLSSLNNKNKPRFKKCKLAII